VRNPVIERAQYLRANMTAVESRMWLRLRGRQLGVKFRRQHPIGPYIADFACCSAKLVVEIDGDTHQEAHDIQRDRWLESRGWRVMRLVLQEIDEGLETAVDAVRFELENPGSMLRFHQRSGDLLEQSSAPS
jgi:very-short-patch-repair endonuclease